MLERLWFHFFPKVLSSSEAINVTLHPVKTSPDLQTHHLQTHQYTFSRTSERNKVHLKKKFYLEVIQENYRNVTFTRGRSERSQEKPVQKHGPWGRAGKMLSEDVISGWSLASAWSLEELESRRGTIKVSFLAERWLVFYTLCRSVIGSWLLLGEENDLQGISDQSRFLLPTVTPTRRAQAWTVSIHRGWLGGWWYSPMTRIWVVVPTGFIKDVFGSSYSLS